MAHQHQKVLGSVMPHQHIFMKPIDKARVDASLDSLGKVDENKLLGGCGRHLDTGRRWPFELFLDQLRQLPAPRAIGSRQPPLKADGGTVIAVGSSNLDEEALKSASIDAYNQTCFIRNAIWCGMDP